MAADPVAPIIDRAGFTDGARAILPLLAPAMPFGLIFGVAVTESDIDAWIGWSSSVLVFAGSAQLVGLQVLSDGAGILLAAFTIWVINARHVMYSAAIAGRFTATPRGVRLAASYVLVDQLFALLDPQDRNLAESYRMSYWIGGGATAWISWQIFVVLGIVGGGFIPESWSLGFSVPILFLGLMILAISGRPGVLAALAGGITAVLAADFPNGTGLLLGAVVGVAVGGCADYLLTRNDAALDAGAPDPTGPPTGPSPASGEAGNGVAGTGRAANGGAGTEEAGSGEAGDGATGHGAAEQ